MDRRAFAERLHRGAGREEAQRREEPIQHYNILVLEKSVSPIMTDLSSSQEERGFSRVPCVTPRKSIARAESVAVDARVRASTPPERVAAALRSQLVQPRTWLTPFGAGTTGHRIACVVDAFLG
jgi:UDP-N-acetylglucosamine 2-epimerase